MNFPTGSSIVINRIYSHINKVGRCRTERVLVSQVIEPVYTSKHRSLRLQGGKQNINSIYCQQESTGLCSKR